MKRKSVWKDKDDVPIDLMGRGAVYIYLVLMFLVFPLYYRNNFTRLAEKKINFFVVITGLLCVVCLFPFVKKLFSLQHGIFGNTWTTADIFGISFLLNTILSGFFSVDRKETFFPAMGPQMGFFVICFCIAAYFCVRCYGKIDTILLWCYLLGSGGIYLWGILLNCKVNFLHIQETFYVKEEMALFASPMGHINYNAAFLALALPPAMAMYLICKEQITKNVLRVYFFLGFLDMFLLRSDSIYIAMTAVFCVLFYFALENKEYFQRLCQIICLLSSASMATFLLYTWMPNRMYPMWGIGNLFLKPYIFVAEIMVIVIVCFAGKKYDDLKFNCRKLQKIWLLFLLLLGILVICGFVFVNIMGDKLLGSVWESFLLTDSFGSYRGYLWKRILGVFAELSWVNKLFGCGLNCFTKVFWPQYKEEMLNIMGTVLYGAHNEFLNILIEWGILGVISYFGMILGTLFHAVKNKDNNPMNIAVIATICSYLGQGLVNHIGIFTFPLFMIFLGLSNSENYVTEK